MRNIHQDQVTVGLQHEYVRHFLGEDSVTVVASEPFFVCIPVFFFVYTSLTLSELFCYSLSNSRRVSYDEVRLPPTGNMKCDLYVDDEVEVECYSSNQAPVRVKVMILPHLLK